MTKNYASCNNLFNIILQRLITGHMSLTSTIRCYTSFLVIKHIYIKDLFILLVSFLLKGQRGSSLLIVQQILFYDSFETKKQNLGTMFDRLSHFCYNSFSKNKINSEFT